ncbi:hypothetical protein KDX16_22955 [Burkholderia vietnamiensis]|nr:hypothetical protein [Burkholderia vietnamiensis]
MRRSSRLDNGALHRPCVRDAMTRDSGPDPEADPATRARLRWWLGGVGLCVLLSAAITWLGAIYDHPVREGVVAGMNASECARVGVRPPGSLLTTPLPEHDLCMPLFVYRASYPDAASDVASYRTWVLQQRVAEFRYLVGYVLLLCATLLVVVAGTVMLLRRWLRRFDRGAGGDT